MRVRGLAAAALIMLLAPSSATATVAHVVAPGESLTSVAAADGLSVEGLAAANGLTPEAQLISGTTLVIPEQAVVSEQPAGETEAATVAEPQQAATSGEASEEGAYVVQPGDTLSALAADAGTTVEGLAALNGLDPEAPLLAGAVLRMPSASSAAAAPAEAESPGVPRAEEPPYPTEETVAPSEVAAIAAEHGVPASLAEAVAEQESGFDNGLTSTADARGVMQILPATWSWISQELAGEPPLEPASASSNVRGGVLFLQWLLNETQGDPALAAAGYYQGLGSVRSEGEYPETERYVESVLAQQARFAGE